MKFEEIVNKYNKLTYKIAIDMTSSPEDSQDLVQEAYLSLYTHYKEYKKLSETEIRNILCKIVLNKCKDYLKSGKRRESTVLEDIQNIQEYAQEENCIEEFIKKDKNKEIRKIIENLKSPYNKILFQYYIQEYTLDEIANINKTTKGTIKVQISRGKKIVEDILRKERL